MTRVQDKKRSDQLDSDQTEKIGLLLHIGGKEIYIWHPVDPLECLMVRICLVTLVIECMQQFQIEKDMMTRAQMTRDEGLDYTTR